MQIVVVDDNRLDASTLARGFATLGSDVWIAQEIDIAVHLLLTRSIDLVISELRVGGEPWTKLIGAIRTQGLQTRVMLITCYGSVESAVSAIKGGACGYLVKPVTPDRVVAEMAGTDDQRPAGAQPTDLTLDRAVREVLTHTVDSAGSIAEAARRLNLHCRSLRRMLARASRMR